VRSRAELRAAAPLPGREASGRSSAVAGKSAYRLTWARESPPFAFRATPEAVYLVGTAASPVGDDTVSLAVEVGTGAALSVRSATSTIAWAGTSSSFEIDVAVAAGAALDWQLQPLIASGRCHFTQRCRIELSKGARLRWSEEIVLGRSGEQPGALDLRLEVNLDGAPLLRHQLALGPNVPGWGGPAVLGANRAMALVLLAGTGASSLGSGRASGSAGQEWAVMPLEGPGVLVCALARDHLAVRAALGQAFAACGADGSGVDD
jgi:urease accessory protein